MKRKLFLSLFIVMFGFLLSFNSLEAKGNYIESKDGVSIRMKTSTSDQGLRFYAKLNESVKDNEHGFYLVYGETTINELKSVISSGNLVINGKEVFKVPVPSVTSNNEFSVVLTGIPDYGYFKGLTAIGYVLVDGNMHFAEDYQTKSVADVALKMANEGMKINDIVNVSSILDSNMKKVYVNASGSILISKGVYELDNEVLKEEFIKDWNLKFGLTLSDLEINNFFSSAKKGSSDSESQNKDLSNTNLYKFFNDDRYSAKWLWLADYLANHCNFVHVERQAQALKGNGKSGTFGLFNGVHFTYSLVNFFNNDDAQGDFMAIDFTDAFKYDSVIDFNDGVYLALENYNLYEDGDSFILPIPKEKAGYYFVNYNLNGNTYSPGQSVVIGDYDLINADYNLISYNMDFYDGQSLMGSLARTYNVEDSFNLPTPTKTGYEFLGWSESLSGGKEISKHNRGRVGDLKYYARWQKTPEVPQYLINYNLNGGTFSSGTVTTVYDINTSTFSLPVPTKSGETFLGWYENANFSGPVVSQINKGSIGDVTLYAKWELTEGGQTNLDLADEAKNALQVAFASGDSNNSVTKDITLPNSGLNDATVTWSSSNTAVVTNAGVVTRQANDVTITLTATIKVGDATVTKTFTLVVVKVEVVDPDVEYTITFNLNGGAWPKAGGTPGYTDRNKMITDFLTEFYNFVKPSGISLNDFMHGAGKTSGFDGTYGDHVGNLRSINGDKTVNPSTGKFVNQEAYNKWVPLIDLMDEYTAINPEDVGKFWSSDWVAERRFKPFILKQNLWGANGEDVYGEIVNRIPDKLKGSIPGVEVEVPSKYKSTSNDITLPVPTKAGDNFMGWYDNADYQGSPVTKITKGSTGNKVYYARYNSTVVPEKPLTDQEKMALAKAALAVGYSSGDNASKVTGKVTLAASGLHGVAVTWASSNTAAITNAGVVTRSETADITVTLTATLKLGSLTETKTFTLKVIKEEPKPTTFTITYNLNGGAFAGFKNKNDIVAAFLGDLYSFVQPGENLNTFIHGSGKTSGFDGLWYSNEDYRAKIYKANTKTGDNNFFLSSSTYQAKWKPFADMMVDFVKVGNPDQDFWASPYTGNIRLRQYIVGEKPGGAWSDEDMLMVPKGMAANVYYEYDANTPTITLPQVTRSNYQFEGWYDNANFTGNKVTNIPQGSSGNKTFYAKWSQPMYNITLNLNGGSISKYSKAQLKDAFLNDLYSFIGPSDTLAAFKGGTWFSNEEYRSKIYRANTKTGDNNYFLSSSLYQAKWKPLADFMVNFVKINPDQDFWASPFVGNQRLEQYLNGKLPGSAWTTADLNATPAAITPKQYLGGSQAIILPPATRSGYTFDGWYTANTGGSKVTQIAANSTGNKTYYARWTVSNISISGTKTLTGTDLWNMRSSTSNLALSGGGLKVSSGSSNAVYESKAMDISVFNELVMSWNVSSLGSAQVQFMVSVGTASSMSAWMTMGYWKTGNHRSAAAQSNTFASVSIDTLTNKSTANRKVKIRFVVTPGGSTPTIQNVSITTKPNNNKVGYTYANLPVKTLNVPQRQQMSIPNIGSVICSPTSLAMILLYYGKSVTPAGLAGQVYDTRWKAYGNWALNASYAGHYSLTGRVEYVTHFNTIANYINKGIPLALSIKTTSTSQLTNSPMAYPAGHLVVIVGFTQISGVWYAVMNDPAVYTDAAVRRNYRIDQLANVMSGYTYVVSSGSLS